MKLIYRTILIFASIVYSFAYLNAQDNIQKDVRVVKPYEPTLNDANKINILPQVEDTFRAMPSYNYRINPLRLETGFDIRPIGAAKMMAEPIPKLYKSYLKMGLGNYVSPLFELYTTSLRSKTSSVGFYVKHHSSNGKMKMENGQFMPSGFANTEASVFGKRIFKNATLWGDIDFSRDAVFYYGFNPDSILIPIPKRKEIKQTFTNAGFNTGIHSNRTDSTHLNYNLAFGYNYLIEKSGNFENRLNISGDFEKVINDFLWGFKTQALHFKPSSKIDSSANTILSFYPTFGKSTQDWQFKVGLNFLFDTHNNNTKIKLYPFAHLQFNAIEEYLLPWFSIDGAMQPNNYSTIASENPYISNDLHVKNTDYKIRGAAGLKGKYVENGGYNLFISYSIIDNYYFYVNDTITHYHNQFDVHYDDIELVKYGLELSYDYNARLSFFGQVNLNNYKTFYELQPWHKPKFEALFTTEYNLRNKIIARIDLFGVGKRYALINHQSETLKGYADLNLSLEYRYTKILSGFINFTNILASRNYKWNYYPSQRFGVLFGFTYAL